MNISVEDVIIARGVRLWIEITEVHNICTIKHSQVGQGWLYKMSFIVGGEVQVEGGKNLSNFGKVEYYSFDLKRLKVSSYFKLNYFTL